MSTEQPSLEQKAVSCETNGHLWGPGGKCVFCPAYKPEDAPSSNPKCDPPFTVERYGSFGAAVCAENSWLCGENERLQHALQVIADLAGSTDDEMGVVCSASWCAEQARTALQGVSVETPECTEFVPVHPYACANCGVTRDRHPVKSTPVHADLTGTTREPPHCPTCERGAEKSNEQPRYKCNDCHDTGIVTWDNQHGEPMSGPCPCTPEKTEPAQTLNIDRAIDFVLSHVDEIKQTKDTAGWANASDFVRNGLNGSEVQRD